MRRWAENPPKRLSRRLAGWAACAAVGVLCVVLGPRPPEAQAARHGGATKAGKHRGATKGGKDGSTAPFPEAPGSAEGQLISPGKVGAGTVGREIGSSGQVDPIAGLGIRNPVCDQLGQIRSRETRVSCESSGMPDSNYPATNYGFDTFITTGLTHVGGDINYALVTILNGIWLGLIFVLKLVIELLGLAFGLNPFSDGQTMRRVSAALARIYGSITDPWLSALVVAGGIWFAYKGLVRREVAAGVGGTLAAIAMLIVGLWVVHQPRASVGRLANLADEVAMTTISAPRSGSLSRPVGTYAEAMSQTWAGLVEVPFAGLNFSDVHWALGKPPPEAVKVADERFCDDVGALALLAVLAHLGSDEAQRACAEFARKRYGRPRRVIDLYLRSSPGSPARAALWQLFDKDEADKYKAKVAAQGGDGSLTRLSMLALFAVGLVGVMLLLLWLSIRLFTQAAVAFIMLLAAPFALFFPMLGDAGRRAFKRWGLTLLGATLAKVIYAALLSIVLLGMAIFGATGGATGFLLACAFAWSVLLKRSELVGWMSMGSPASGGGIGRMGEMAGAMMGARLAGRVTGAIRGAGRRGGRVLSQRFSDGAEATRATAHESLGESARGLADNRHREAKRTVAAYEGNGSGGRSSDGGPADSGSAPEGSSASTGASRPAAAGGASSEDGGAGDSAASRPDAAQYKQAKELLARVDRNEKKLGRRWSDRDLKQFGEEDRKLLAQSNDPADHAHRAGYGRSQFEELRGDARTEAIKKIEKATKRDRRRFEVSSEVPGRVVGRRRQAGERIRQLGEGPKANRKAALRGLRRERRERRHAAHRRNLSRGA